MREASSLSSEEIILQESHLHIENWNASFVKAKDGFLYAILRDRHVLKFNPVDKSTEIIELDLDSLWGRGVLVKNGSIYCPPASR